MRFSFGQSQSARESRALRDRIAQLREDLATVETSLSDLCAEPETTSAYRSVWAFREDLTRGERDRLRAELSELIDRQAPREAEPSQGPAGTALAPAEPTQMASSQNGQAGRLSADNERTSKLSKASGPAAEEERTEDEANAATASAPRLLRLGLLGSLLAVGGVLVLALAVSYSGVHSLAAAIDPAQKPDQSISVMPPSADLASMVLVPAGASALSSVPLTAEPEPTALPEPELEPEAALELETQRQAEGEPEAPGTGFAEPAIQTGTVFAPGFRGANLRSHPATSAPMVRWVSVGTRVDLLGGPEIGGGQTWQRVRTPDGFEGWVIARAIRG